MARLTIIDHSLTDEGSHHAGFAATVASAALRMGQQVAVAANRLCQKTTLLNGLVPVRNIFRRTVYENGSFLAGLDRKDRWQLEPGLTRPAKWWTRWNHLLPHNAPHRTRNLAAGIFATDCEKLFAGTEFTPADRILVATASDVELLGLCRFLARNPQTILATWDLLFHFNLLHGRPPEYASQLRRLRFARDRFQEALGMVPYHQVRLHATTETLAMQYNRMGVGEFTQLAWPVDDRFRPDAWQPRRNMLRVNHGDETTSPDIPAEPEEYRRPLRVVMPGTVRREKGQTSYLAELVSELQSSHLDTGRLQFILQAPKRPWYQRRKIRLGTPLNSPREFCSDPVVICPHPLAVDDYTHLIDSADIGLLMYDQSAYYARRAGVMCELLSRGRPVIVSAGTWLADELEEYRHDQAVGLAAGPLALRTLERADLEFSRKNLPHPGGVLTFDQQEHAVEFEFPVAAEEAGVVVEFQWHHPTSPGSYCRIGLQSGGSQDALSVVAGHHKQSQLVSAFFRLDSSREKCRFRLTNAFHDACVSVQNIRVTMLDCRAAGLPLAQVGLAVHDHRELAAAIREMEMHYSHYRRTAMAWAGDCFARQNGQRTVEQLMLPPPGESQRRAA